MAEVPLLFEMGAIVQRCAEDLQHCPEGDKDKEEGG